MKLTFSYLMMAGWLAIALGRTVAAQSLVINEFMALNETSIQDEDGEFSDWVEIYNNSSNAVNLEGWYLTDKSNDLTQWQFPSTNLAAGGFLLVFASGKDRAVAGAELHANFSLKGTGEYMGLVQTNGLTIESEYAPKFPIQYPDISYGHPAEPGTSTWIAAGAPCLVRVPTNDAEGSNWIRRTGFDDSSWSNGITGVGYDADTNYLPLIGTDVSNQMFWIHPAVYIRIPFEVRDASLYSSLLLKMKYDDGYFAYLNGVEIARRYAPESAAWNVLATNFHPDVEALIFEEVAVPDGEDQLVTGTNVLAILGMNNDIGGSDLLFLPELHGLKDRATPLPVLCYFQTPTPGAENDSGTAKLGPLIRGVTNAPAEPADGQNLLIIAGVTNTVWPVSAVRLNCRVMYSNEAQIAMLDDGVHDDGIAGNRIYGAAITSSLFSAGQMVRWYVTAVDNHGQTSRWPMAEAVEDYLGTVVLDPLLTNGLPVFHWFVENPTWHCYGVWNSLEWSPASVFYQGTFYDNIRVRVRGQTASGWTNAPFKFEFNRGKYFQYDTNFPLAEEINLNSSQADKSFLRPILANETYRDGGAPWSETFPIRIQQNAAFYSVAHFVEQVDERYLEHRGMDPNGALYKMFNLLTNATDEVEKHTRKNEPNDDLQALVNGLSETNTIAGRTTYVYDHVDIPAALTYLAATVIPQERDCFQKNYYLYCDSEGSREWRMLPWDKDLTFGRNWSDVEGVLNDDISFNDPPLYGTWKTWNRMVNAFMEDPVLVQMFARRLRSMMDELLQEPLSPASNLYFETRIRQLVPLMAPDVALHHARWGNLFGADQDFAQAVNILSNEFLVPTRHHLYVTNHVSQGGIIPDAQAGVPHIGFGSLEFCPASGNQDEEYIELVNTNGAAVDISGWSFSNAVEFTFVPGTVIASNSSLFVSPDRYAFRQRMMSPKGGENRMVAGDYGGHLSAWGETVELWSASGALVSSTSYTGAPSDSQRYFRMSELMYDPRDPPEGSPYEDGFFEFIEFRNLSSNTLDLTGIRFSAGFSFMFTNGVTSVGPTGLLVLARNRLAFATRYDTNGMVIAGDYDGRLSNNGETLKIEDPLNETILEFDYSDQWYTNTDGGGYSLNIRNPNQNPGAWNASNAWRSSVFCDGSPGWDDSDRVDEDLDAMPDVWESAWFGGTNAVRGGAAEDFDGDGVANLDEYAAGTCPTNPADWFQLQIIPASGSPAVFFPGRKAEGLGYARQTRRYDLQQAPGAMENAWSNVPGFTDIEGTNQAILFSGPNATASVFRAMGRLE
ncbi:MAG: lamin tail domain-containing protein [Lentisphaerota bacterium]